MYSNLLKFLTHCYCLGLVTEKLNMAKKLKGDSAALLKSTNHEPDYNKREDIFKMLWPELTHLYR